MRLRNIKGSREVIGASDYVVHEEETKAGTWHEIFGNDHPIYIEVGMGKGQFIMELAKRSTYLALINSPAGVPRDDGINWKYLAKGFPSDISEIELTFAESESRENIESGETVKTVFGKIKKWLADLTAPAFAQMISAYTDLMSNTVAGYVPDALAVKEGFKELSVKSVNLYSGNASDWALLNYLTVDVTSEMQAQLDEGFPQVIRFQFGSGSQSIGVAAGNIASTTIILGIDTWVGACPIIEGKTAFFIKQDNKIYIWCDENPSLALRNVLLMKNV